MVAAGLGAEWVVNSSSDSYKADLVAACKATGCTLAFDAIGGGSAGSDLLECMETALTEGKPLQTYGSKTHKQVGIEECWRAAGDA